MRNALILFILVICAPTTQSEPVIIEIPEPAAILFPSPEAQESIAVGRNAVYRVSTEGAVPILRGSFQLSPKPLQSSNNAILILLDVKDDGLSEVVVLSLKSGIETRFERRVRTRYWTWLQPDQSLLLVNEEGMIDDIELLEFNLKTLRMDARLTANDQICDLLTASPSGKYFMEVARVGRESRALAQTFIHRRENQSESFVLPSGVNRALWLNDSRFLAVNSEGDANQFLDFYTLPSHSTSRRIEASARVLSLGPGRLCEGAALSPLGDYVAIGVRDNAPANRYGEDAEEYDASFVQFIRLSGEGVETRVASSSDGAQLEEAAIRLTHQPSRWERFAWSPCGGRYVHATERVFAKPEHTISTRTEPVEREYPIRVYFSPSSVSSKDDGNQETLVFASPDPVISLCWSRDGSTLFSIVTPMGDARIVIAQIENQS